MARTRRPGSLITIQRSRALNRRCSRPLCSSQHTIGAPLSLRPMVGSLPRPEVTPPDLAVRRRSLRTQQRAHQNPLVAFGVPDPERVVLTGGDRRVLNRRCSTLELTTPTRSAGKWLWPAPGTGTRQMLLRKEVIQPHLPVRLPCYDLVLIASPTFDGSLHKGWATGFGCYRLS